MSPLAKFLVIAGAVMVVAGLVVHVLPSGFPLGRLPGDIRVERPGFRRDFVLLSAWGVVLSVSAWSVGTWWPRNVPLYWWVFGGSLLTWGLLRWHASRTSREAPALKLSAPGEPPARAA